MSKQIRQTLFQKKNISFLIKVGLTVLILYLILRNIPIKSYKQAYQSLTTEIMLYLISLVVLQIFILAYRWRFLIHITTGKRVAFLEAVKGIFISFFVSQGLLASVGADAFKVWWMKKRDISTQSGVQISLMDRIYGLVSLMVLCTLSLALFFIFIGTPHSQIVSLFFVIIFVGLILCFFFIPFKLKFFANPIKSKRFFPSFLAKIFSFGKQLRELLSQQKFSSTIILLSTSLLAHTIVVIQAYLIGHALNPSQLTLLICILAIPPAIFVSYMPFSIAGWGIREASMVMAFGLVSVDSATAFIISITIGMAVFVTSLMGGFFWIFSMKKPTIAS